MPVTISGSGTITGIAAGGLPDGSIASSDLADNAVTAGKLASSLDLTGKTVTLPSGTGGKVLQVLQGTLTNAGGGVATTSSTFQNTGLQVNITPSSANSRILVISNFVIGSAGATAWQHTTLYRDGTNLGTQFKASQPQFAGCYNNNASDIHNTASIMYVDSPDTTSQINYAVYFRSQNNSANVRFATDGIVATIIAMEIAA